MAANALLCGSESAVALPVLPVNASHSRHAFARRHLVACQTNKQATQSQSVGEPLFCCLIAITRALQPEATNAWLGGSESCLALPLPPENAPHSPHASTPRHLVCMPNEQASHEEPKRR